MAKSLTFFDFDHWSQLAKDDPERFESLRLETIEFHINKATEANQDRLRCLQWRIDRIRENAKNPMDACISISNLMWDNLDRLVISYQHLKQLNEGQYNPLPSATILKFEFLTTADRRAQPAF